MRAGRVLDAAIRRVHNHERRPRGEQSLRLLLLEQVLHAVQDVPASRVALEHHVHAGLAQVPQPRWVGKMDASQKVSPGTPEAVEKAPLGRRGVPMETKFEAKWRFGVPRIDFVSKLPNLSLIQYLSLV